MALSARAQGQAVIEYLGKRPAVKSRSLVGSVTAASKFEDTRNALLEKMSDSVRSVLSEYDEVVEKDNLVQSFQRIALLSSVLQLGAVVTAAATAISALGMVPGVASVAAFAASSVFVMSQGTKQVSSQYQEMWKDRQSQLDGILEAVCAKELEKGIRQKILAGVAPYTRYVETEQERVSRMTEDCETVQASAQALRNRISKLHRY
jgi:Skp family chaperone for outer membrane proteins